MYNLLEKLPDLNIPLLIHGETANSKVDIYDREAYFLEKQFTNLETKFRIKNCIRAYYYQR